MTCWGWNLLSVVATAMAAFTAACLVAVVFCAVSEAIVALRRKT